jgi:hypothetical protein
MLENTANHFVHPRHQAFFIEAAEVHACHILVRETGAPSIHWIGKEGYTGKRGDLKAKTAKKDVGHWQLAGLVCSPDIHPGAFGDRDPKSVRKEWQDALPLITVPPDARGFDDDRQIRVKTPYILQTNPAHKHFGCVAWVEHGLVTPKYIHGDYDLFAILPLGNRYNAMTNVRVHHVGSTMDHPAAGSKESVSARRADYIGPLTFNVANYINARISMTSPGIGNALMINHGEELNLTGEFSNERVCAFLGRNQGGYFTRVLAGAQEQRLFFQRVKNGD